MFSFLSGGRSESKGLCQQDWQECLVVGAGALESSEIYSGLLSEYLQKAPAMLAKGPEVEEAVAVVFFPGTTASELLPRYLEAQ